MVLLILSTYIAPTIELYEIIKYDIISIFNYYVETEFEKINSIRKMPYSYIEKVVNKLLLFLPYLKKEDIERESSKFTKYLADYQKNAEEIIKFEETLNPINKINQRNSRIDEILN